jgi:hypothetical protein
VVKRELKTGTLDQAEHILRVHTIIGGGDPFLLADVLTRQGRVEEAGRLVRFGLAPDGSTASR